MLCSFGISTEASVPAVLSLQYNLRKSYSNSPVAQNFVCTQYNNIGAPFFTNWQKYAIVLGLNQPQILSINPIK